MTRLLGARYEVQELIGAGGMADVYRGYDNRLNRVVAIKILRADLARDPSLQSRFRREAQAAARLNHPNIVSVYDTGEEQQEWGTLPYIVMEYVEGTTIRELLRQDIRPDYQESLRIVHSLLDALAYSHENGIVHRDIKPANIMVTNIGEIKVMDFGIARPLDDVTATVTHAWTVIGTAQYLSPEQARGEQADIRSDIYSAGCVLFELISGKPPFVGETPAAIAYHHVNSAVPLVQLPTQGATQAATHGATQGATAEINTVLQHALTKDAELRYQSAALMRDDVDALMSGKHIDIPAPAKNRRGWWISGIVAAGLLILGGAALVLTGAFSTANTTVVIADLTGLTVDEARSSMPSLTLVLQHAPDPRTPKDRVITSNPAAGSKVLGGSKLTLTISDGPGDTTVPASLIGKTLEGARQLLLEAGLVIARTNPVDSEQPPGTVLAVTPIGGSAITAGSGVTLDIASGNVAVPDVRGLSEIQARTTLIQAGFLPRIVDASDPNADGDTVLAQAPEPGVTKIVGTSVTITINRVAAPTPSATP